MVSPGGEDEPQESAGIGDDGDGTAGLASLQLGGVFARLGLERIGDRDKALDQIGRALAAGYSQSEISNQPELTDLYEDPRYAELIASMDSDR